MMYHASEVVYEEGRMKYGGKNRRDDVPSRSRGYQATIEQITFQQFFLVAPSPLLPPHTCYRGRECSTIYLLLSSINTLCESSLQ